MMITQWINRRVCFNNQHLAQAFIEDESGATSIEYGLIVAMIFLAIVSAVTTMTESTTDMYNEITSAVEGAGN